MREIRAGLIFSVSLSEKYIRNFGQIKYNIGSLAPVYLAAVLESVARHLLQVTREQCASSKRHNITVRHLFLAVNTDKAFSYLIDRYGIVILGGGVMPNLHESLVSKSKKPLRRKKVEGEEAKEKRAHRWRPGTVAIRNIRAYQKSDELLVQNAPFERIVRELSALQNPSLRFTHEFMVAFQHVIEYDVVRLLAGANNLAIHSGRETVQPTDINLYVQQMRYDGVTEAPTHTVPVAAINKMGYRAGVKRLAHDAKVLCQRFICNMITKYMNNVIVCTAHNRRRTVNTKFLLEGLSMCGVLLATVPEKRRLRKKNETEETAPVTTGDVPTEVVTPAKATPAVPKTARKEKAVPVVTPPPPVVTPHQTGDKRQKKGKEVTPTPVQVPVASPKKRRGARKEADLSDVEQPQVAVTTN